MSSDLIDVVNSLSILLNTDTDKLLNLTQTETVVTSCDRLVDDVLFYQVTLIPAFLIVLGLCCTQSRRAVLADLLKGRPGLVFPMDLFTWSNRLSYACAFGSTAFLLTSCIFHNFVAIEYEGPLVMKTLIILVSVLIFGMVYFPVFASLTLGSIHGFAIGAAYVWVLTVVAVVRVFQCDASKEARIIGIMRNLPSLACLLFLSVSISIRFVKSVRAKKFHLTSIDQTWSDDSIEDIGQSAHGRRVRKLLRPAWKQDNKPSEQPKGLHGLFSSIADVIYRSEPDFQYSGRLIATFTVGLMVLYIIAFETLVLLSMYMLVLSRFKDKDILVELLSDQGEDTGQDALDVVTAVIDSLVNFILGPLVAATIFAFLLGVWGILRMFVGYRDVLHRLHKGELKDLIQSRTNTSLLVGCLKYSGFQVTYIAWGFVIHVTLIGAFCLAVSLLVFLGKIGATDWLVNGLLQLWPIPLWTILIYGAQIVTAKFFFLQQNGRYLALTNRRVLFVFSYFMFFYNVFLGVFSTLLRLIKGAVIGAIMIPRLDSSTLPFAFTESDPGYNAYIGFMQLENAQSHPVVHVFLRLLSLGSRLRSKGHHQEAGNSKTSRDNSLEDGRSTARRRNVTMANKTGKQRAAAFNWLVLYTLINNPDLRMERKGYLQAMRRARELGIRIPMSDGYVILNLDEIREADSSQSESNEDFVSKATQAVEGKLSYFKMKLMKMRKSEEDLSKDETDNAKDNENFTTDVDNLVNDEDSDDNDERRPRVFEISV